MSSRQEEKERRRREREEREAAIASKAAARRRLGLVAGAVIAIAVVAGVVIALASGGGGSEKSTAGSIPSVPIPAKKIDDFTTAVKAAGCVYRAYPSEGRQHFPSDTGVNNHYKTNPPTSGEHRPTPAADGIYAPGQEPAKENAVHTLEHGRIEIEYAPGSSKKLIGQLESLYQEPLRGSPGYHTLLFQNNTHMPYQVAAVAWTQLLGCKTMNPKVFDAIRAFRQRFVDKGPELIM